jgi:hypothetical protein
MAAPTDADVIARAQREPAAFAAIFDRHHEAIHAYLFDPHTAEVLNERQVVAHPVGALHAPVGTAIEDIVYTKRAVTDATVRP